MGQFHAQGGQPPFEPSDDESDQSSEAQAELRRSFEPAVARHRRVGRILFALLGLFVAALLSARLLSDRFDAKDRPIVFWTVSGLSLAILVSGIALLFSNRLKCPHCARSIDSNIGSFCPTCGKRSVEQAGWFRGTRCSSCDASLSRSNEGGRLYRIHACTHCGFWLDDKGL
ncbi:MAG TPA: hypothetical protein VHR72_02195 [Gemmataceae bacterium]|jgi:hypothetical protein|nr:hypothetical protein [Gemmataceae bacterium]